MTTQPNNLGGPRKRKPIPPEEWSVDAHLLEILNIALIELHRGGRERLVESLLGLLDRGLAPLPEDRPGLMEARATVYSVVSLFAEERYDWKRVVEQSRKRLALKGLPVTQFYCASVDCARTLGRLGRLTEAADVYIDSLIRVFDRTDPRDTSYTLVELGWLLEGFPAVAETILPKLRSWITTQPEEIAGFEQAVAEGRLGAWLKEFGYRLYPDRRGSGDQPWPPRIEERAEQPPNPNESAHLGASGSELNPVIALLLDFLAIALTRLEDAGADGLVQGLLSTLERRLDMIPKDTEGCVEAKSVVDSLGSMSAEQRCDWDRVVELSRQELALDGLSVSPLCCASVACARALGRLGRLTEAADVYVESVIRSFGHAHSCETSPMLVELGWLLEGFPAVAETTLAKLRSWITTQPDEVAGFEQAVTEGRLAAWLKELGYRLWPKQRGSWIDQPWPPRIEERHQREPDEQNPAEP